MSDLIYDPHPLDIVEDRFVPIERRQRELTKMLLAKDGLLLKFITNPTDDEIAIAVKQNGDAIKFVSKEKHTDDLMWEAIRSNPHSIWYMDKKKLKSRLYIAAVITPYTGEDHPVHLLKTQDKMAPYLAFISHNPHNFQDIIDDIRGLEFEHLIWRYVISNWQYSFSDVFAVKIDCPIEIQAKIVDEVVRKNPQLLEIFDKSFWTEERMKNYVISNPVHVNTIWGHIDMSTGDLYRLAFDNCKDSWDVMGVLDVYPYYDKERTTDEMVKVLESKRWYDILNRNIFSVFASTRENAEYIIDRFAFEELADKVKDYRLKEIIKLLPFFKRIKYKHKLKKYDKNKKEENKNEQTV